MTEMHLVLAPMTAFGEQLEAMRFGKPSGLYTSHTVLVLILIVVVVKTFAEPCVDNFETKTPSCCETQHNLPKTGAPIWISFSGCIIFWMQIFGQECLFFQWYILILLVQRSWRENPSHRNNNENNPWSYLSQILKYLPKNRRGFFLSNLCLYLYLMGLF